MNRFDSLPGEAKRIIKDYVGQHMCDYYQCKKIAAYGFHMQMGHFHLDQYTCEDPDHILAMFHDFARRANHYSDGAINRVADKNTIYLSEVNNLTYLVQRVEHCIKLNRENARRWAPTIDPIIFDSPLQAYKQLFFGTILIPTGQTRILHERWGLTRAYNNV